MGVTRAFMATSSESSEDRTTVGFGFEELSTSAVLATLELPQDGVPATYMIAHRVLEAILFVVILGGNALTLTAIARFRWMQSNSNLIVASLAVADISVALRILIQFVEWFMADQIPSTAAHLLLLVRSIIISSSVCHIVLVALDRFIAVVYPFFYHSHVTTPVVKAMVVTTWLLSVALLLPTYIVWALQMNGMLLQVRMKHISACIEISMYFAIGLSLVIFHGKITYVALKQRMRVGILPIAAPTYGDVRENNDGTPNNESEQVSSQPGGKKRWKKPDKATRMFTLVLCAFLVLYFPYVLQRILTYNGPWTTTIEYLWNISVILAECNSAVNVFIYGLINTKFRLAFKKILHCAPANGEGDSSFDQSFPSMVGTQP